MLSRAKVATILVAVLACATTPAIPAHAAPSPHAVHRVLHVAPDLGMPGSGVVFFGQSVPRHVSYRVYFDVTTSDKVPLCGGKTGTATKWRCIGRIPRRFGALGLHTVEMDAVPASGRGGFIELSTFLVTDLGVAMSAPATTAPGDTVQFKITESNGNAVAARGVRLVDGMPAGLHVTKVTAPCRLRHEVVRCGPFNMGVRTQRVITITAIVTARRPTHLFDRVVINGSPDPLHGNDAVRVELTVT